MGSADASVVALLGVPGSGKSIVARRLCTTHGFKRMRFTDPLREMLGAGFGLTDEDVEGQGRDTPLARLCDMTPAKMFSSLAFWARDTNSKLLASEWARRALGVGGFILVDDLQRPCEADAIWEAGGVVVRIDRPGYMPRDPNALRRSNAICADAAIINDGGTDVLTERADRFAHQILQVQGA